VRGGEENLSLLSLAFYCAARRICRSTTAAIRRPTGDFSVRGERSSDIAVAAFLAPGMDGGSLGRSLSLAFPSLFPPPPACARTCAREH
jgi:hypothetical protein